MRELCDADIGRTERWLPEADVFGTERRYCMEFLQERKDSETFLLTKKENGIIIDVTSIHRMERGQVVLFGMFIRERRTWLQSFVKLRKEETTRFRWRVRLSDDIGKTRKAAKIVSSQIRWNHG